MTQVEIDHSLQPRIVTPGPTALGTCDGCRYWQFPTDDGEMGRCHFNAPSTLTQIGAQAVWPRTHAKDWCGQYSGIGA